MHGPTTLTSTESDGSVTARVRNWLTEHKRWCLLVLLPTLLIATYYFVFAADQYESEAHFLVRSADSQQPSGGGLSQALSLVGGAGTTQADAESVADYLTSHDAVSALQQQINLTQRFERPEADLFSRLLPSRPTPERLLDYYHGKVDVEFKTDTGITTLKVRSFRPKDSFAILNQLLSLSEARVNMMNQRTYDSTLRVARQQLAEAEDGVKAIQARMTAFRHQDGDVNPKFTGQARLTMVTELQGQLAQARAQEQAMARSISPNSPQLIALRQRVSALQTQVSAEQSRLASGKGNVATGLGTYEELEVRQEFASKRYEAAAAAVERARDEATKQQLFIIRVVNPNMPVKSLYPKRLKIVITAFLSLLLIYGIGWLVAAGVREHAA